MADLTSEQQAFLHQCERDFANRYSMEDQEFKVIYEAKLPSPPIMGNWYPRNRRQQRPQGQGRRFSDWGSGGRGGGNRYSQNYRDRHDYDMDRDRTRDRRNEDYRELEPHDYRGRSYRD